MPDTILPTRLAVGALMVAPALEVVEQLLSPLTGRSTSGDLAAVAAHQTAFTTSVLVGLVATACYVPGLLALARTCLADSPGAARLGAVLAVVSMLGFAGVRMMQAVELEAARGDVERSAAAALIDSAGSNPIGATLLVMFLGGTVVGMLSLAVACWRTGLPRPAVALMIVFPFADLALQGRPGAVASHAVLLVALAWIRLAIGNGGARPGSHDPGRASLSGLPAS